MNREEATRQTAENLGCTPEQLEKAINHFKKIEEAEANKARKKLDEIIMLVHRAHADWTDDFSNVGQTLQEAIKKLEKFKEEEL